MESKTVVIQKKKRCSNWDSSEKALLEECLKEFITIINNKRGDTNTVKRKSRAWQVVSTKFNEMNTKQRSVCELRQQWKRMKISRKKNGIKSIVTKPLSADQHLSEIMIPHEFEKDIKDSILLEVKESDTPCINIISEDHNYLIKQKEFLNMESYDKTNLNKDIDISTPEMQAPIKSKNLIMDDQDITVPTQEDNRKKKRLVVSNMARKKAILKNIEMEHILKMKHMSEMHEWAREEHDLKMKKLKLEIMLLQKQFRI